MIDTLSIARQLRDAELSGPQAEAIAAAIGRSLSEGASSKTDFAQLERKLDMIVERLELTRTELKAEIRAGDENVVSRVEAIRSNLLTWIVGVILATAGFVVAILRFPPLQ